MTLPTPPRGLERNRLNYQVLRGWFREQILAIRRLVHSSLRRLLRCFSLLDERAAAAAATEHLPLFFVRRTTLKYAEDLGSELVLAVVPASAATERKDRIFSVWQRLLEIIAHFRGLTFFLSKERSQGCCSGPKIAVSRRRLLHQAERRLRGEISVLRQAGCKSRRNCIHLPPQRTN